MRVIASGVASRRALGFTLIEILVVVVIIGILAAIVAPRIMSRIDDAQIAKARQDIRVYETAPEPVPARQLQVPDHRPGPEALVQQPADPRIRNWKQGGYVDGLKKDPWGYDYQYVYPGTHGTEYDLFTLGADNQPGGEGINADIGNWSLN